MSKLRLSITMSLDGYVAGPEQNADNPIAPLILGAGERLFRGLDRSTLKLKQLRAVDAPGVTHIKYDVT